MFEHKFNFVHTQAMATTLNSRGVNTRRRILDATLSVIAADGVRAVTHRRVATAAGASVGLITYYFASTDELIAATLEDLAQRETARLETMRAAVEEIGPDSDRIVDLFVEDLRRCAGVRREDAIGAMALTLEIPRERVKREAFDAWESAQIALFEAVGTAIGAEFPEGFAIFLSASMDGLELYSAIAPDPAYMESAARAGLQHLLRAHLHEAP